MKTPTVQPADDAYKKLRSPLEVIIRYSNKLLRYENQLSEEVYADIKKINTLGGNLLELFDQALKNRPTEGKRTADILSGLGSQKVHDLRTSLNGIIGYTELISEVSQDESSEKFCIDLDKILSAAKEFLSLLNESFRREGLADQGTKEAAAVSDREQLIAAALGSRDQHEEHSSATGFVGKGVILIVDDNKINRDLLATQLGRQGHSVRLAGNGREALEIMQEEAIDLVLLDLIMPEMNGFELLAHFKKRSILTDIPVIVISALDTIDGVVQSIQMGAEDYLLKPINSVLLKVRINSCLEKKRLLELSRNYELGEMKRQVQFIAESKIMQHVLQTVRTVSRSPVSILLHGNSGTGKELIARMIHNGSDRQDKPFVAVNCASIPENLMESEFFGYEKGAFTGAAASRAGYFEEAEGGTLFLDEIGDMPKFVQPKLLRAIEEGEGRRLGSNRAVSYDVRVISATNKDLREEVKEGRFRKDLFYRIFSVEINIPPLAERREDIVPLAVFFLNKVSRSFDKEIRGFSADVLSFFEKYPWPGNVRQLLHEVERLVAFTPDGAQILLQYCSPELLEWKCSCSASILEEGSSFSLSEKVKELEIKCINDALRQTGGKKLPAAKLLNITRVGLDNKIKRYGIKLPWNK